MIVHRLLDVFFRTLDAVDMVRDRVDRMLGREPRPDPWAVSWPPAPTENRDEPKKNGHDASGRQDDARAARGADDGEAASRKQGGAKKTAAAAKQGAKTKAKDKKTGARKDPADAPKTKPATKKPQAASRKGSVDRSGKDFDSPRARAIHEQLKAEGGVVVTEDAALDGKKVLARVVWALNAANSAGSELGLTAADASALLHLSAGLEVFATNIARTCRDETTYIEESVPDGRSKRYKLTTEGKARAAQLPTRPV